MAMRIVTGRTMVVIDRTPHAYRLRVNGQVWYAKNAAVVRRALRLVAFQSLLRRGVYVLVSRNTLADVALGWLPRTEVERV